MDKKLRLMVIEQALDEAQEYIDENQDYKPLWKCLNALHTAIYHLAEEVGEGERVE